MLCCCWSSSAQAYSVNLWPCGWASSPLKEEGTPSVNHLGTRPCCRNDLHLSRHGRDLPCPSTLVSAFEEVWMSLGWSECHGFSITSLLVRLWMKTKKRLVCSGPKVSCCGRPLLSSKWIFLVISCLFIPFSWPKAFRKDSLSLRNLSPKHCWIQGGPRLPFQGSCKETRMAPKINRSK